MSAIRPPEPLARWDFTEAAPPFCSTAGDLPLAVGTGPIAPGHSTGTDTLERVESPFGYAVRLGGQNWLVLDAADVGRLNIGATGNTVSVAAWVRNVDTTNGGAVAGLWREDSVDPQRQYCLFYSLPYYNGGERVCMHVSRHGGPTPGPGGPGEGGAWPYSKDYSASLETITRGGTAWELYVGTYDGQQAISYLNGRWSFFRTPFTDRDGIVHTEAKNPYVYPDGLNDVPSEFTVGAVRLTAGWGNLVRGDVARLRVWDTCLTPQQVRTLYDTERP